MRNNYNKYLLIEGDIINKLKLMKHNKNIHTLTFFKKI